MRHLKERPHNILHRGNVLVPSTATASFLPSSNLLLLRLEFYQSPGDVFGRLLKGLGFRFQGCNPFSHGGEGGAIIIQKGGVLKEEGGEQLPGGDGWRGVHEVTGIIKGWCLAQKRGVVRHTNKI